MLVRIMIRIKKYYVHYLLSTKDKAAYVKKINEHLIMPGC